MHGYDIINYRKEGGCYGKRFGLQKAALRCMADKSDLTLRAGGGVRAFFVIIKQEKVK